MWCWRFISTNLVGPRAAQLRRYEIKRRWHTDQPHARQYLEHRIYCVLSVMGAMGERGCDWTRESLR